MTLKELQEMIKEEFDALQNEAKDDVDVSVSDADVDADATGDDGSEDMLRQIYDMLKAKFEGEEEAGDDMDDMGDMDEDMAAMDEVKGDEEKNEEADMQEFVEPSNTKTHGPNVGMTPAKTTKGDGRLHESVKRFQKLANIIK